MICVKCGNNNKDSAQYCTACGGSMNNKAQDTVVRFDFYSKNWNKTKWGMTMGGAYDIAVANETIYMIVLPQHNRGAVWAVVGLFLGSFLGLIIGMMLGNTSDEKKREVARSAWLGHDNVILSRAFEPISQIVLSRRVGIESIKVHKKKLLVTHDGKDYVFKSSKKANAQLLEQYLFTHGLSKM